MTTRDATPILDAGNQLEYANEGSTHTLTLSLKDADGVALNAALVSSITLEELYNDADDSRINGRQNVDVQDASIGTVNGDGTLSLRFTEDDNVIVDDTLPEDSIEEHVFRLKWEWNDGTANRVGRDEWKFGVRKLAVVS